ncbi:MAG: SDR family oxidoreductase [Bacteroidota bacterium]
MNQSFQNKVAIITGAGSGIGLAIAQQLGEYGVSVILNDISSEKAYLAAEAIQLQGGACLAIPGDASKLELIDNLIDAALNRFGRLDFCIANAGLTHFGDFFSFTPEAFEDIMDLNLKGTFFLCQAVARQFRKSGIQGRLLVMSSNIGAKSYPNLTAYSMSKAALQMMVKSLVLALSPYQISINALAPGATLTPRTLEDEPNYERQWQDLIPLGKVATPKKIAEVALFLLSPAANHITGQTIVVDGGWNQTGTYPSSTTSKSNII